jgi:3-hydroxybutyryl-CoA dehydrogenase
MAIQTVGVVGSGIMGSGLAEVIARGGMNVIVRSRSQATADAMVTSVAKGLAKQVEKGRLTEDDKAAILGRITAVSELSAILLLRVLLKISTPRSLCSSNLIAL